MSIADDRIIYEGLTRYHAIRYLVSQGLVEATLKRQSDDSIAVLYDIAKRKEVR